MKPKTKMHKENKTKENKMISRYERQCGAPDDGWISRSPYMSVCVELSFNCADCFSIYRLQVLES